MQNIDYLCAKYGQEIPEKKEDRAFIQKALGVLQEDGLFAFMIFLEAREKKEEVVKKIKEKTESLLRDIGLIPDSSIGVAKNIQEITKDINKMLFAKNSIEKMLIYARYHAEAQG